VVRREGNPVARQLMERVFEPEDGEWRGFGIIPASGLKVREKGMDAVEKFSLDHILVLGKIRTAGAGMLSKELSNLLNAPSSAGFVHLKNRWDPVWFRWKAPA